MALNNQHCPKCGRNTDTGFRCPNGCDQEPLGSPCVFSGEYSKPMWEEINKLSALSTGDEVRDALHFVCCRIQELEAKLSKK